MVYSCVMDRPLLSARVENERDLFASISIRCGITLEKKQITGLSVLFHCRITGINRITDIIKISCQPILPADYPAL